MLIALTRCVLASGNPSAKKWPCMQRTWGDLLGDHLPLAVVVAGALRIAAMAKIARANPSGVSTSLERRAASSRGVDLIQASTE